MSLRSERVDKLKRNFPLELAKAIIIPKEIRGDSLNLDLSKISYSRLLEIAVECSKNSDMYYGIEDHETLTGLLIPSDLKFIESDNERYLHITEMILVSINYGETYSCFPKSLLDWANSTISTYYKNNPHNIYKKYLNEVRKECRFISGDPEYELLSVREIDEIFALFLKNNND